MKLPDTRSNPPAYQRPLHSSPYATLNLQGTFRWTKLEIYAGCENVAGYRQPNPIISADNPFGKYFDLSSVWGPTRGREFYAGARHTLEIAERGHANPVANYRESPARESKNGVLHRFAPPLTALHHIR